MYLQFTEKGRDCVIAKIAAKGDISIQNTRYDIPISALVTLSWHLKVSMADVYYTKVKYGQDQAEYVSWKDPSDTDLLLCRHRLNLMWYYYDDFIEHNQKILDKVAANEYSNLSYFLASKLIRRVAAFGAPHRGKLLALGPDVLPKTKKPLDETQVKLTAVSGTPSAGIATFSSTYFYPPLQNGLKRRWEVELRQPCLEDDEINNIIPIGPENGYFNLRTNTNMSRLAFFIRDGLEIEGLLFDLNDYDDSNFWKNVRELRLERSAVLLTSLNYAETDSTKCTRFELHGNFSISERSWKKCFDFLTARKIDLERCLVSLSGNEDKPYFSVVVYDSTFKQKRLEGYKEVRRIEQFDNAGEYPKSGLICDEKASLFKDIEPSYTIKNVTNKPIFFAFTIQHGQGKPDYVQCRKVISKVIGCKGTELQILNTNGLLRRIYYFPTTHFKLRRSIQHKSINV